MESGGDLVAVQGSLRRTFGSKGRCSRGVQAKALNTMYGEGLQWLGWRFRVLRLRASAAADRSGIGELLSITKGQPESELSQKGYIINANLVLKTAAGWILSQAGIKQGP